MNDLHLFDDRSIFQQKNVTLEDIYKFNIRYIICGNLMMFQNIPLSFFLSQCLYFKLHTPSPKNVYPSNVSAIPCIPSEEYETFYPLFFV